VQAKFNFNRESIKGNMLCGKRFYDQK